MINNRQGGRRRGRGGGGNGQRQGGQQGNGSRIDNRARGNANQLYEKYKNMAADAQRAGDRVNTEYYLQFADHYFRVLSEQRGGFEQQQRRPRDDFDLDGEDDYGDEGEPVRGRDQWSDQPERADEARRDDVRRDEGRRDDGRRDDTRQNGRDDGRSNDGRQNRDFRNDGRRDWRDRPNGARNGEPREGRPAEPELIAGQRRAEPLAADESVEARAAEVIEADRPLDPPAPRRRGRPRREETAGEGAPAFDADRLPPALGTPANDAGPDEGEAKPRRRRLRTAGEETPTAAE